jgi:hypothetical protein
MILWQFLALLAVHWIADFVLQTHWQASNKSKDNAALAVHVINYTATIGIAVPGIFFRVDLSAAIFVAVNGVLHFITDWCTSRVSSRLFMGQFQVLTVSGPGMGISPGPHLISKDNFNPHNFFVVIGLDQLIHQATLTVTMWAFLT